MIDLDLLDRQLEQALTDDVRTLRGIPATAPAPSPHQEAPAAQPKKLSTDGWDWDEDDAPAAAPAPAAAAPVAPRPEPEPEPVFVPRARKRRREQPPLLDVGPVRRTETRTPLERLREAAAAMETGGAPVPQRSLADLAERIPELLSEGRLADADAEIANHAGQLTRRGIGEDRLDAAAWGTMRALLDGRRDDALAGLETVNRLGRELREMDAAERYWTQRFWIALEWGDDAELYDVLDHCRERAYRYDDVVWRGALSVQHARMGREDEAAREFDTVAAALPNLPADATRLDIVTNLAETAFLLGDATRAAAVQRVYSKAPATPLVVVGPAWVCKGSADRFAAHLAAATGKWTEADKRFAAAAATHRTMGAQPLLARTLKEWGSILTGRDDTLARRYLDESADLARRLQLTGLPSGRLALTP